MLLDQHGQPFRFTPAMPVQSYVTWTVAAPTAPGAGFWRAATCDEVDCPAWAGGWVSKIDEATPLGHAQAAYLRSDRTRRSSEERGPDGLTWFTYAAGQTCFQAAEHRVRAGRPPLFLVRGGDWRANLGGGRVYDRDDQWVDDFASHQQRLIAAQQ